VVLDFCLRERDGTEKSSKTGAVTGLIIFVIGLAVAVEQMVPNQNSCFAMPWHFFFHYRHFMATISTIYTSYIPLPDMNFTDFWNSNVLAAFPLGEVLMPVISLVLAVCCVVCLYRTPIILFLYASSTVGILLFTYLVYFGSLRHHGHLFIVLVMCFWLAHCHKDPVNLDPIESRVSSAQRNRDLFLTVLLCLHFISGAFAFYMDLRHPFSAGQAVAEFIKNQGFERMPVVGDGPYMSTVGAYLNKEVYYADRSRAGTFVIFDRQLSRPDCPALIRQAKSIAQTSNQDVILVLRDEIPCAIPGTTLVPLIRVAETISDERAYVYMLKHVP
jgi:hypothetical protein